MPSNDQYGKRLAVNYIDQTARSDPTRTAVYQTITVGSSTQTHTVTYRNLANIINNLARWLDELTPVTEEHTRTIGYLTALKHAQTGYGKGKLIASLLLHRAGELAGVRGSICRLGQIAGPVDSAGVWPHRDWFPSLLDSSQAIGYLPDSLGAQDSLTWIPVDILAELIADLALTGERSGETTSYYHFVNPQSAKWADMAPSVIAQGQCTMTSLSDWVRRLEDHAARAASSETQPSSGVKLIGFYKSLQSRPLDLETCQTQDVIPRLGSIPAVNEEWMRAWLRQWAHSE